MDQNTNALPDHLLRPRLSRSEASEYLGRRHGIKMAVATLAKLACVGGSPPYQKDGRRPAYPVPELDAWAIERLGALRTSTSDPGDHDPREDA